MSWKSMYVILVANSPVWLGGSILVFCIYDYTSQINTFWWKHPLPFFTFYTAVFVCFCHCTEEGTCISAKMFAFIKKYLASVIKYTKKRIFLFLPKAFFFCSAWLKSPQTMEYDLPKNNTSSKLECMWTFVTSTSWSYQLSYIITGIHPHSLNIFWLCISLVGAWLWLARINFFFN